MWVWSSRRTRYRASGSTAREPSNVIPVVTQPSESDESVPRRVAWRGGLVAPDRPDRGTSVVQPGTRRVSRLRVRPIRAAVGPRCGGASSPPVAGQAAEGAGVQGLGGARLHRGGTDDHALSRVVAGRRAGAPAADIDIGYAARRRIRLGRGRSCRVAAGAGPRVACTLRPSGQGNRTATGIRRFAGAC